MMSDPLLTLGLLSPTRQIKGCSELQAHILMGEWEPVIMHGMNISKGEAQIGVMPRSKCVWGESWWREERPAAEGGKELTSQCCRVECIPELKNQNMAEWTDNKKGLRMKLLRRQGWVMQLTASWAEDWGLPWVRNGEPFKA